MSTLEWTRRKGGFDKILGKYIMKKVFELGMGSLILDVGCGDGFLTKEIARHYDKVVGIDGSADKINIARQYAPDVEFHISLFEEFEYDMEFDSIIMINILEHVNDPILFLKRAKDFLNPDGEVIIFVPNALSLNRRIGKAMGLIKSYYDLSERDLAVGHKRFYDKDKLRNHIMRSGLKIDEMGGVLLKPLSNSQMESWNLDIIEALYEVGKELPDYCGPIYARAVR